jgi:Rrf2 family nitric oxide-sensitive transcriptional repressor
VECFNAGNQPCTVTPVCVLKEVLHRATDEFLGVLDRYTLADAIAKSDKVEAVFPMEQLLRTSAGRS